MSRFRLIDKLADWDVILHVDFIIVMPVTGLVGYLLGKQVLCCPRSYRAFQLLSALQP